MSGENERIMSKKRRNHSEFQQYQKFNQSDPWIGSKKAPIPGIRGYQI
jgi:hypothetical protein